MAYEDQRYATLKLAKDGKEVWAQVDTAWGRGYMLTIVEKQAMVQEVTASADLFRSGLKASRPRRGSRDLLRHRQVRTEARIGCGARRRSRSS